MATIMRAWRAGSALGDKLVEFRDKPKFHQQLIVGESLLEMKPRNRGRFYTVVLILAAIGSVAVVTLFVVSWV